MALCAVALFGCDDSGSDPMATLVAAETHGALAMAEDLPSLPELTRRVDAPNVTASAELWTRSWDEGDEGDRMRQEAYMATVPPLAATLGPTGIRGVLDPVLATLAAARTMDEAELPGFVIDGIAASGGLAAEAEAALDRGDLGRALLLAFEAADGLRKLGPEEVARDLLIRAEEAIGRDGEDGSYSELELERSRHLLLSAAEAMGRNDYLRAIRRAFYACQLLGVELN
jgi:hypothetical protein